MSANLDPASIYKKNHPVYAVQNFKVWLRTEQDKIFFRGNFTGTKFVRYQKGYKKYKNIKSNLP